MTAAALSTLFDEVLDMINRGESPLLPHAKTKAKLNQISNKLLNASPQVLTDQATIAWDCALGNQAKVTLAASRIMGAPTNIVDGQTYVLEIVQSGAGSFAITWNAAFVWTGGVAPTLTTTTGKRDFMRFIGSNGSLYGLSAGLNFA